MTKPTAELAGNQHPSVMFELIAKDQTSLKNFYQKVWTYNA